MNQDHSPAIVLVCLVLLSYIAFLGYKDLQTESLSLQMDHAESEWKQAVEARKEKRQEWCVNYVSAWSSNVGLDYDPEALIKIYRECL